MNLRDISTRRELVVLSCTVRDSIVNTVKSVMDADWKEQGWRIAHQILHFDGVYGDHTHLNAMLDYHIKNNVGKRWFLCVDDDNLMHPNFFSLLNEALDQKPDAHAVVFWQGRGDWAGPVLRPKRPPTPCNIDGGGVAVWGPYGRQQTWLSDGQYYRDLYKIDPERWFWLHKLATYHNKQRW